MEQVVLDLLHEAFKTALILSMPVMLATLVVGVAVSVFQSITSIQEQTMVLVPKMIAVFLALLICFSWMMNTVLTFTRTLFMRLPELIR